MPRASIRLLRRGGVAILASVLASIPATSLPAQVSLRGTVFDSLLTNAPLAGAQVVLEGVPGAATTDQRGRFTFDSVAPGRHRLTFFHPRLDSLSMSAPIVGVDVGPRGRSGIRLAVPSFATTARALCDTELDASTSIVLARIRDAEAGRPLPDALGELSWWELNIGAGAAPRQEVRRMVARADSTGSITLCGVPNDIELSMSARLGSQSTGEVVLPRGLPAVAVRELWISLSDTAARLMPDTTAVAVSDAPSPPRGGSGVLRVLVQTERGTAIRGAYVSVRGQSVGGVTAEDGVARIRGVPAGSQTVDARAIGHAPDRQVAAVVPGAETTLSFRLGGVARALPDYVVRGIRPDVEAEAFERRRRGGVGRFLDSDDLDKLGRRASGLATLPGLFAPLVPANFGMPAPGGDIGASAFSPLLMRSSGELCRPTMIVDGLRRQRVDGFELNSLLQIAVRVEVYNRATFVPVEFADASTACGVVAIWTR